MADRPPYHPPPHGPLRPPYARPVVPPATVDPVFDGNAPLITAGQPTYCPIGTRAPCCPVHACSEEKRTATNHKVYFYIAGVGYVPFYDYDGRVTGVIGGHLTQPTNSIGVWMSFGLSRGPGGISFEDPDQVGQVGMSVTAVWLKNVPASLDDDYWWEIRSSWVDPNNVNSGIDFETVTGQNTWEGTDPNNFNASRHVSLACFDSMAAGGFIGPFFWVNGQGPGSVNSGISDGDPNAGGAVELYTAQFLQQLHGGPENFPYTDPVTAQVFQWEDYRLDKHYATAEQLQILQEEGFTGATAQMFDFAVLNGPGWGAAVASDPHREVIGGAEEKYAASAATPFGDPYFFSWPPGQAWQRDKLIDGYGWGARRTGQITGSGAVYDALTWIKSQPLTALLQIGNCPLADSYILNATINVNANGAVKQTLETSCFQIAPTHSRLYHGADMPADVPLTISGVAAVDLSPANAAYDTTHTIVYGRDEIMAAIRGLNTTIPLRAYSTNGWDGWYAGVSDNYIAGRAQMSVTWMGIADPTDPYHYLGQLNAGTLDIAAYEASIGGLENVWKYSLFSVNLNLFFGMLGVDITNNLGRGTFQKQSEAGAPLAQIYIRGDEFPDVFSRLQIYRGGYLPIIGVAVLWFAFDVPDMSWLGTAIKTCMQSPKMRLVRPSDNGGSNKVGYQHTTIIDTAWPAPTGTLEGQAGIFDAHVNASADVTNATLV